MAIKLLKIKSLTYLGILTKFSKNLFLENLKEKSSINCYLNFDDISFPHKINFDMFDSVEKSILDLGKIMQIISEI
jgi:hypothetical protein